MAQAVPIPVSLLDRLARLDRRCDIFMNRRTEYIKHGAGGLVCWTSIKLTDQRVPTRRAWHVRIMLHDGNVPRDIIDCCDVSLASALEAAVTEAEGRGWQRLRRCEGILSGSSFFSQDHDSSSSPSAPCSALRNCRSSIVRFSTLWLDERRSHGNR